MARFLRHFTSLLKTGLETLFEPAEDPRDAFGDPLQRQQDLIKRVRESLARNVALRRHLEARIAQLQTKVPALDVQARQALAGGREDLARLALQQKQIVQLELRSLEAYVKEVQLEEGRITIIDQRLTAQIEAMRVRQEMVAVRYTAAESQVMMSEALSSVYKELSELGVDIEQAEQNAEHMQARAAALDQLATLGTLDPSQVEDTLATTLRHLDIEKEVEEQLNSLKGSIIL